MTRRAPKSVPDVLAAVDLGSNSFHMVVARYTHGQLVILDRLRETALVLRAQQLDVAPVGGELLLQVGNSRFGTFDLSFDELQC